ncbi:hypothetical protein LEP1GSC064_1654 [Leptospira kirschneri serovar Grippotyphosa str. Moskva]|uniref:Uncharacterized protein n=1 Tax=Leptospira kirschneri serovar Bulgarica str. Nikolaevo TaxID=1240687 RepID=M6F4T8_9LEPT|nr:hypothetical protein LEP1GSC018_1823 [Leptospira kirschneri str. 2008720114]EKQ85149.1 hypothetical protein LEP1GSC064_1654 [Leptospira kirschneri serovar Grippotyphosa str. Moskva]EKR06803.1 hypothetical protein LEP1GSC122_0924 [Leptospira kirschneri serovar Valbuzzi str. 200702274]EMK02399.1 hypothetical protein LEP1GSC176_3154 [Leptospira kirschneri str. MMD1493]EMK22047.1 hypothetical protein LEP1GSC008_1790 [Leptospira kirschneri serovar Bulgarica str. Nikolaevo]EMN05328.1 hypothetical
MSKIEYSILQKTCVKIIFESLTNDHLIFIKLSRSFWKLNVSFLLMFHRIGASPKNK